MPGFRAEDVRAAILVAAEDVVHYYSPGDDREFAVEEGINADLEA